MTSLLAEISADQRVEPEVAHALEYRTAVVSGNYHRIFKLYKVQWTGAAPLFGPKLFGHDSHPLLISLSLYLFRVLLT